MFVLRRCNLEIFLLGVKSLNFHPRVKRNGVFKKCDAKQFNFLLFTKNEEIWMLHKAEYWDHDYKIFRSKSNQKRSGKWRAKGVLLSSLNIVLRNSSLLLQSFGILLFMMLQQKRSLNYLMQETIVSRNKALATYKRTKLR